MPPASPEVLVDVLGLSLEAESDCDLSNIPPSCIIEVCFSLCGEVLLIQEIQENCNKFSINRPSNSEDIFRVALCGLHSVDEQRQLRSCVERLQSDGCELVARLQSFERQV